MKCPEFFGIAAAASAQRGLATRKVRSLSLSLSSLKLGLRPLALVLEGVLVRLEQVLEDALAARVTRGVDGLDLDFSAHAEERVDARQQLALGGRERGCFQSFWGGISYQIRILLYRDVSKMYLACIL